MIQGIGGAGNSGNEGTSPFQEARQQAMGAVAGLFGESVSDLQSQLQSGQSLTDLASAQGISTDDLQKTIQDSLQQSLPQSSPDQISNLAQRMVSGHGHHHHHAEAASASGTDSNANSDSQSDTPNSLHVVV